MKGREQEVIKEAANVGAQIKETMQGSTQAAVKQATRQGMSIKESLGLTDAMAEGIYSQAYRLYNAGNFRDAIQIFRMLMMVNTNEPKFAMGLAACLHMLKEYKNAADVYAILAVIDATNPVPFYHASDCFIHMKDNRSALIMLKMAVKWAGDKPEYRILKDRALLMIEGLEKELPKGSEKI